MSRTVSEIVSLDVFKGIVAYHWSKHEDFQEAISDWLDEYPEKGMKPEEFLKATSFNGGKNLTSKVSKDLSKVRFDMENFEWEGEEENSYEGFEKITGFHILPNGMAYLGCCAGGDWEKALFFILYYDGNQLRGYIPTDGNTWNTDTNSAYGNEHDTSNLKKRFGVDDKDMASPNSKAIIEDIQKRITIVPGAVLAHKAGMDDIDWDAIEKIVDEDKDSEKEFEKNQKAKCGFSACQKPSMPVQEVAKPIVIPLDPNSVMRELEEAKEIVRLLTCDLESLVDETSYLGRQDVKELAAHTRDVTLKELVAKVVKITLAIEHMG